MAVNVGKLSLMSTSFHQNATFPAPKLSLPPCPTSLPNSLCASLSLCQVPPSLSPSSLPLSDIPPCSTVHGASGTEARQLWDGSGHQNALITPHDKAATFVTLSDLIEIDHTKNVSKYFFAVVQFSNMAIAL